MSRLAVCASLVLVAVNLPAAAAVDVSGDDANDQFVGSGGSSSHHSSGGSSGSKQHSCPGCSWMAADPCSSEFNAIGCGRVTEGCPPGQEKRRMWFSLDDGLTWLDRGLRCVALATGGTGHPSGQAIHEAFVRAVPRAVIASQPSRGLLPQVHTLFSSGQPRSPQASSHRIGSLTIRLSPQAHWHWDFGDGGVLDTQTSGSSYPDRAVSHIYRSSGVYEVRLRTTWTASYTVDGQGPFAVDGSVTQASSARIVVGQGRAVLG